MGVQQESVAEVEALLTRAGGLSWQSRVLNAVMRYAIKRRIAREAFNPHALRRRTRLLEALIAGGGGAIERKVLAGVPCDVIRPRGRAPGDRVVLYLHGGGFFLHMRRGYRRFGSRIADALGATVWIPDYRLAPEYRYPAGADDCMAVYRALLEQGGEPARMALMGDSAGGNLALAALLRARDEGLPLPACALLLSPGADMTMTGASYRRNAAADPMVPAATLRDVALHYADAGVHRHPYVSPALADLAGLPPLHIVVGSTEVLLDTATRIARSAQAAGGEAVLRVWRRMPHVFPAFPFLPEGQIALRELRDFFNRCTEP